MTLYLAFQKGFSRAIDTRDGAGVCLARHLRLANSRPAPPMMIVHQSEAENCCHTDFFTVFANNRR